MGDVSPDNPLPSPGEVAEASSSSQQVEQKIDQLVGQLLEQIDGADEQPVFEQLSDDEMGDASPDNSLPSTGEAADASLSPPQVEQLTDDEMGDASPNNPLPSTGDVAEASSSSQQVDQPPKVRKWSQVELYTACSIVCELLLPPMSENAAGKRTVPPPGSHSSADNQNGEAKRSSPDWYHWTLKFAKKLNDALKKDFTVEDDIPYSAVRVFCDYLEDQHGFILRFLEDRVGSVRAKDPKNFLWTRFHAMRPPFNTAFQDWVENRSRRDKVLGMNARDDDSNGDDDGVGVGDKRKRIVKRLRGEFADLNFLDIGFLLGLTRLHASIVSYLFHHS